MDDTGTTHPLPDGTTATLIGRVAVLSAGEERTAICRDCGREIGRWRAEESAARLRCGACRGEA